MPWRGPAPSRESVAPPANQGSGTPNLPARREPFGQPPLLAGSSTPGRMAPVGQASKQAPSAMHRSRSTRAMSVTMAASVGQAAWQPLHTMQSAASTQAFLASGMVLANAFTALASFGLPVNLPPTSSGAMALAPGCVAGVGGACCTGAFVSWTVVAAAADGAAGVGIGVGAGGDCTGTAGFATCAAEA